MATVIPKEPGALAYPYGHVSTDEETLSEVLNALHHNSGVPQEGVRVEVRRGHVVLSGVVEQEFQRELAETVAKTAPGVVEVTNNLTVAS